MTFKKPKWKAFSLGIALLSISIYGIYTKLGSENYEFTYKASPLNGYLGFFLFFALLILSILILNYSLRLKNPLSKKGKKCFDLISNAFTGLK